MIPQTSSRVAAVVTVGTVLIAIALAAAGQWDILALVAGIFGAGYMLDGLRRRLHARAMSGPLSVELVSSDGVEIEVTADAVATIVERGGHLYLWQTELGNAWLRDHLSFDKPERLTFHETRVGLLSVMIASGVALPRTIAITGRRFPPGRVDVEWDGKTWGQRGDGGGGGG